MISYELARSSQSTVRVADLIHLREISIKSECLHAC